MNRLRQAGLTCLGLLLLCPTVLILTWVAAPVGQSMGATVGAGLGDAARIVAVGVAGALLLVACAVPLGVLLWMGRARAQAEHAALRARATRPRTIIYTEPIRPALPTTRDLEVQWWVTGEEHGSDLGSDRYP